MGYVSTAAFADWVSKNCGYNIPHYDLPGLSTALDKNNDYRISRQEFIDSIAAPQYEDDEEEGEGEED